MAGAAVALAAAGGLAATGAAGPGSAAHSTDVAVAALYGVDGRLAGRVYLRQDGDLVRVRGWARSLTPGFHGFHVHATGLCEADAPAGPFTTAGGHFTGGSATHGDHAGDMPSLLVTQEGRALASFITDRFSLADLRDADGSAVIVHAGRDNFANIPTRYESAGVAGPDATTLATGDAGARAACGVID